MPKLRKAPKGASKKVRQRVVSKNVKRFSKTTRFKKAVKARGKKAAIKQAVAAAYTAARGGRKRSGRK